MDVLYIEDNRANARLMERYFSFNPDWTLRLAGTADEGISAIRAKQPDLILMDINLPGKSGRDAFHELRRSGIVADTPVIAISADARPDHIEEVLNEGFDAYITKPIDFDRLEAEISRHGNPG